MNKIPFYALYGETRPANQLDFIHVESDTHGGRDVSLGLEIRAHRHENLHQFIYLERGRIVTNVDTIEQEFDVPCLISIPPMTVHSIQISPGSKRYVLTVSQSFLSRLFLENEPVYAERLLSRPVSVKLNITSYPGDQMHDLIMRVHREYFSHLQGRTSLISAFLTALLIQLGRLAESQGDFDGGTPQQADIYNRFRAAVEQQYRDHWEVRRYAEALGVTEDRLNQICKRAAGCTPSEMVRNRLLTEAKRNLVYTNKPISAIAYELGFADPNYFSRFFGKHAGEPASAFKARFKRSP